MKLKIKKKWFDKIKSCEKDFEIRDAHLTLICEETKEFLKADIIKADIITKADTKAILTPIPNKEFKELFEDNKQIKFKIKVS